MKRLFLIILFIFSIFVTPSYADGTMSTVEKLWFDHNPQASFREIVRAFDDGEKLDPVKLTELSGVRKIEKLIEGKGDETVYFLDDDFILLIGFTGSLRICRISSLDIFTFPFPTYPVWDQSGVVFHEDEKIYYYRKKEKNYFLTEFNIHNYKSKLLGDLPGNAKEFRYDPSGDLLQFIGEKETDLRTFDLKRGKKIEHQELLPKRDYPQNIEVSAQPDEKNIVFIIDGEKIEMPYPRLEYLDAVTERHLHLDDTHPDSILVSSLWYPGLKILFDIRKKRSFKVYLPLWLDPFESSVSWKLAGDKLYLWRESGEKSGLYVVDLARKSTLKELVELLVEFNFTKRTLVNSKARSI